MTKNNLAKMLVVFLVLFAVYFAKNDYTGSDPRAELLVSESILERGTVKLDHYGKVSLERYGGAIQLKNEHYYYYFPIGTSLISIPFVAIAKIAGFEMLLSESKVQIAIAIVTSIATLLLLINLAQIFLDPANALIVSAVFWFGTSLSSTCATALWSHNFATLFALLSVYCVIQATKNQKENYWPIIAVSLFLAYLCRPTMALLAPFVLLYFFSYFRLAAIKVGVLLAALIVGFMLFSMREYGQILPDYYLPKRLDGKNLQEALFGNLFSPARGLLVYSPFLLLVWSCYGSSGKEWGLKKSWLLIGLAWPLLHLITISRFPHWWGGWAYGARLMTDAIPGLFLLTVYAWPTVSKKKYQKLKVALLSIVCAFSVFANSINGLFNPYAAKWNADPNIDENPEYLFDWSYPQFFANPSGHRRRVANYFHGLDISYDFESAKFSGWSNPESGHRWSDAKNSRIVFFNKEPRDRFFGYLIIDASENGSQRINILLNGKTLFSGYFKDITIRNWDRYVKFSPSILNEGDNILVFELPDARPPGNGDSRLLALDLRKLRLR